MNKDIVAITSKFIYEDDGYEKLGGQDNVDKLYNHIKEDLARKIGTEILKQNLIKFSQSDIPETRFKEIRAVVQIVDTKKEKQNG